jgi:Fe-S-cluster containining protein
MSEFRDKKIDKLYSEIPELKCKGLCYDACGVIPLAPSENRRIEERTGENPSVKQVMLVQTGCYTCPQLKDNKCSIYDIRPMICRLYGVVKKMQCRHGCRPKKFLPERKSRKLLLKLEEVKP